ncbi:MAG: MotA/TolQ/ExbB proton channel family protein [Planctomycetes bacterium]|nr:MotA/TolQ/ExbB proton channel family protein [Planctomycetota bacterium]
MKLTGFMSKIRGASATRVLLQTIFAVTLILGTGVVAYAQPEGEAPVETVSVLDNIQAAGAVGVILILLSGAGMALTLMHGMQLRRDVLVPPDLLDHVESLFETDDFEGALDACEQQPSFLSSVLAAGLPKIDRPYEDIEEAMEEAGEMESSELHRKISYISLIAAISPMLGLLGTVMGMVGAFNVIATSKTSPKPKDLASGISEALMTTMMGLIVAIPMTISYFILKTIIDGASVEVSSIASELMSRFDDGDGA